MKIPLHGISEDGLKIDFNQTTDDLKQKLEPYFSEKSFSGHFELRPTGEHFHMRGDFHADLDLECSFCNENFSFPINEDFQEILAPAWQGQMLKSTQDPKDFFDSQVEVITGLEGEDFYLDQYLKEVLEFALPTHPKCKEDCKGLCLNCGQNLNQADCECPKGEQTGALAFTALKDLKIDKKH